MPKSKSPLSPKFLTHGLAALSMLATLLTTGCATNTNHPGKESSVSQAAAGPAPSISSPKSARISCSSLNCGWGFGGY